MRSHPYTAPPPLPSILDDLASYLPNQQGPRREPSDPYLYSDGCSDAGSGGGGGGGGGERGSIMLRELDPETSHLLAPPPPRSATTRVHVRVQGRLALVQSVSSMDLRQSTRRDGGRLLDPGVGSLMVPERPRARSRSPRPGSGPGSASPSSRSVEFGIRRSESDTEGEEQQGKTVRGDRQLRGYGIGGAGNIRRPTEVVHFPSRRISSMTLFSSVPSSPIASGPARNRWNLRDLLGRRSDRKGRNKATDDTGA